MPVILTSKVATPEDTAKALGVSKTRFKRLMRLLYGPTGSPQPNGSKMAHKNGRKMVTSAGKNARGKAKKVAR